MSENKRFHVQNYFTTTATTVPESVVEDTLHGEIVVMATNDNEKLIIKNSEGDPVAFPSEKNVLMIDNNGVVNRSNIIINGSEEDYTLDIETLYYSNGEQINNLKATFDGFERYDDGAGIVYDCLKFNVNSYELVDESSSLTLSVLYVLKPDDDAWDENDQIVLPNSYISDNIENLDGSIFYSNAVLSKVNKLANLILNGVEVATVDMIPNLITVDAELNTTSENPVQNKVITNKINTKADNSTVNALEGVVATKAAQSDLTTHTEDGNIHVSAQQKTDWQNATDAINAFLATEGDTTAAIDTLKEIQDFLTSDDGTVETLLGKVDALEGVVATHTGNTDIHVTVADKERWDNNSGSSSLPDNVLTVDTNNVLNKSNLIIGGVEIKNGVTQYILTAENLYNDESEIDSFNVEAQFTGNYVNETDGEGNETGTQFMEFEVTYAENNMSELTTLYVRILNSNWDENNQISGDYLDIKTTPNTDYLSCGGSNIVLTKTVVETLNTDSVCEILINGEKVATKSEIPSMTNVLKVENDGLLNRNRLKIQTRKTSDPENSEDYIDGDDNTFFNVEDGLFNVEVQSNNDANQDTEIYSDGTSIQLKSYFETEYSGIEIAANGITMYQNGEGNEVSFSLNSEGVRINGSFGTNNMVVDDELKTDSILLGPSAVQISGNESTKDVYIDGAVNAIAYYETSDERLKTFGNDINVDFDKLSKLRKSYFTFIEDPGNGHLGVSAQEVKEIYPEIVNKNKDGYLSVDYSKLSVIALKAIDQLDERLKKLESLLLK